MLELNKNEFSFQINGGCYRAATVGTISWDEEKDIYCATIIAEGDQPIQFDAWDRNAIKAAWLAIGEWLEIGDEG